MLRTEVVQEVAQEVGREGGRRGESGGCAPSAVGRLTVTEMLEAVSPAGFLGKARGVLADRNHRPGLGGLSCLQVSWSTAGLLTSGTGYRRPSYLRVSTPC